MDRPVVLVVDDDALVLRALLACLKSDEYELYSATSGPEALLLADQLGARLKLLVTDFLMPRMSGTELIRLARAKNPGIRVLLLSGLSPIPGFEHETMEKPYDLVAIRARIAEELSLKPP